MKTRRMVKALYKALDLQYCETLSGYEGLAAPVYGALGMPNRTRQLESQLRQALEALRELTFDVIALEKQAYVAGQKAKPKPKPKRGRP